MVPGSLVAVLFGIVLVKVFSLDHHGVDIVGPIKSGLPTFGVPKIHGSDVGALAAGGVGVMLVGFAEGLGAAKTYAAREHQQIDPNRELLGLGGANIAAALSSGMVVNGSLSKSAVNASAGARSQLSGLMVAGLTILTLLASHWTVRGPPRGDPRAVVIAAVVELVDVPGLVSLYRAYSRRFGREFGFVARPDFIAAIAALLGVTVFDTLPGLFIGITASLLLLDYRASRPYVATLGKTPDATGTTATSTATPTPRSPGTLSCYASRAACTSPMPTPSAPASSAPPRPTASRPSWSTERRSRSSTSPRRGCSPTSQTNCANSMCNS